MGTALLALSSLFAPIQSWVARHADARRSSGLNATELHYVNVRPRPGGEMRHAASSRRDAAERPRCASCGWWSRESHAPMARDW